MGQQRPGLSRREQLLSEAFVVEPEQRAAVQIDGPAEAGPRRRHRMDVTIEIGFREQLDPYAVAAEVGLPQHLDRARGVSTPASAATLLALGRRRPVDRRQRLQIGGHRRAIL